MRALLRLALVAVPAISIPVSVTARPVLRPQIDMSESSIITQSSPQKAPLPAAEWIPASDTHLSYYGRIGFTSPSSPADAAKPGGAAFYYPSTSVKFRFKGTSLAAKFFDHATGLANSFGVTIDGSPEIPVQLEANKEQTRVIAVGLPNRVHTVEIYRRQDTWTGPADIEGVWLDEGATLLSPPPRPKRKIEFYGDSVCAGAASLAFGYENSPDNAWTYENENGFLNDGYWSFSAMTARAMNLDAHIQGIGGLPLLDKTGWYGGDLQNCVGLETTWDKLNPNIGQFTNWDFSEFTPQVVVISVGQNDAHGGNIEDASWRQHWEDRYLQILSQMFSHYPKAHFVLTTTVLDHDLKFDESLKEIAAEFCRQKGSETAVYFGFKRAGKGTPGHPRYKEQLEMATELTAFLESKADWWK